MASDKFCAAMMCDVDSCKAACESVTTCAGFFSAGYSCVFDLPDAQPDQAIIMNGHFSSMSEGL